ncbi:MAG: diguanylate cyclase [Paracoccaceae bacterium]
MVVENAVDGGLRVGRRSLWLGALVVALVAAAMVRPGLIVDRLLASDVAAQSAVWRERIIAHLETGEETFSSERVTPDDAEFLAAIVETSDVFRLRLIGPGGRVFWASIPAEVGTLHPQYDHGSRLDAGEILVSIDSDRAHEYVETAYDAKLPQVRGSDSSLRPGQMIAEIDAPVRADDGFGRIEMFVDLTHTRSTFVLRVRAVIAAVAGVVAMAGVAILTSIVRANRLRLTDLRTRSQNEHRLLAEQLQAAREVRLLGELNEWLQSSRSLDELFDMVSRFLSHILPGCQGSVYIYSNSRDVLDGCASWNGGEHKDHIHPEECWGLRRGRTYVFGEGDIDFTCAHAEPHDGRSYFCIPVLAHGETIGLMHLREQEGAAAGAFLEGRRLAQMCAEQISLAVANVKMRDQLQDQSIRDPLTGLFNRRHLTDSLRRALGARSHSGAPLAVLAVDVDHFKRFNDNHGHDAGDMVLRAVAAALAQQCDRDELASRIGGEEFMVLLPEATVDQALQTAETIRLAAEAVNVRYGEKSLPRVTISIGAAIAPVHGTMPQELMRAADEALYAAKAAGRNQVCLAPLPGESLDFHIPRDAPGGPAVGDSALPRPLAAE